jgi:hypothetical protein
MIMNVQHAGGGCSVDQICNQLVGGALVVHVEDWSILKMNR